jgi:hypothetical protein
MADMVKPNRAVDKTRAMGHTAPRKEDKMMLRLDAWSKNGSCIPNDGRARVVCSP